MKQRKRENNFVIIITITHGHTSLFYATDVTAQFILSVGILDEFRLNTEAPHLV